MKTFYKNKKLTELLKLPALIILLLAFGFSASAQSYYPASNSPICAGQDILLTVVNPPSGVHTYQWSNYNGTWTSNLQEPTILASSGPPAYMPGLYSLSVDGGVAQYTVVTFTSPVSPPTAAASQTICYNTVPAGISSTVPPTGSGYYYYIWQQNSGSGFADISGATNLSYTPTTPLTTTTLFRLKVTDWHCYSTVVYSNVLEMWVQNNVTAGSIAASQTICNGSTPAPLTSVTPGTGDGTISYKWENSFDAGSNWNLISGATSNGYAPGALTTSTQYRRTTISTTGSLICNSAATTPVTILVQSAVTAGAIAANQTICYNTTPAPLTSTTPGTGSGTITYSWEANYNGAGWTPVSGTAAGYAPGALTSNTQYRRTTVSTTGSVACNSSTPTNIVAITVESVIGIGSIAANQTICYNTVPAQLTSTSPGTGSGTISYQWQSKTTGSWSDINGATLATYAPAALIENTSYQRFAVTTVGSVSCTSATAAGPVVIVVQGLILVGAIGSSQTICYNTSPNTLLGSTTTPPAPAVGSYSWENSIDNGSTWVAISGATTRDYAPGALTATTKYRRFVIGTTGSVACSSLSSNVLTVTVQSVPTAGTIAASQTICEGYSPAPLTSTTAGTGMGTITYTWENSITGGSTWNGITGATSAGYAPGALTINTMYRRTTVSTVGSVACTSVPTAPVSIFLVPVPTPVVIGTNPVCQSSYVYYNVNSPYDDMSIYDCEWIVTGGSIEWGQNTNMIAVYWGNGTVGQVKVAVTIKSTGCVGYSTNLDIIHILPVPAPLVSGPGTSQVNQSVQYTTPLHGSNLYTWDVMGGLITAGQGTNLVTVLWTTAGVGTVTVTETTSNAPGPACSHSNTLQVTVYGGTYTNTISGQVFYNNQAVVIPNGTPLNGIIVELVNPVGGIVKTTTTATALIGSTIYEGYYQFDSLIIGSTYTLRFSTTKWWGGVNATDALMAQLYDIGAITLTPLQFTSGDVDLSTTVNSTDALWIKMRTVGMVSYFPAGDWVFNPASVTVVAGVNTKNVWALCVGDINESYYPPTTKAAPAISMVDDGTVIVPAYQTFYYNIKADRAQDLGAMTLNLNYDMNSIDVEEISTNFEGLQSVIKDGKIAIAWSDLKPLSLGNNDLIVTLKAKTKVDISTPAQLFSLAEGIEFADARGNVIDSYGLKMAKIATNDKAYSLTNFPNPFQHTTDIVYTLPEQGKVTLVITNTSGQVVKTLVNMTQEAGSYKLTLNPNDLNMAPGVYMYHIQVDGISTSFTQTNKLVFTK